MTENAWTARLDEADAPPLPLLELGDIRLRPLTPADTEWLYKVETDPRLLVRWRLLGRTPSPADYQRVMWQNVLSQFVVESRKVRQRAGVVLLFNADFVNGTANIALVADPAFLQTSVVTDGAALLIEYAFRTWPLRKLYGETIAFNLAPFEETRPRRLDLTGLWEVEGCLKDNYYYGGRYHDKYLVTISREGWERVREANLKHIQEDVPDAGK